MPEGSWKPSAPSRTQPAPRSPRAAAPALFPISALAALALHAWLAFGGDGLQGGADLKPHLRLIQEMAAAPGVHNVYPPAYHVLGAALAPSIGLDNYPATFALFAAAALILAFRYFQRAAGLPDASALLFVWSPYLFALSRCTPKIEAAGYALAFLGLGLLLRRRYVGLGATLVAAFWVHTAAALFLGLCGGVLALAGRDRRALSALALGTLAATPLVALHLAAGCTPMQALLFSPGDYLRTTPRPTLLAHGPRLLALAHPIALAAGAFGARSLWQERRPVALLCAVVVGLYLNEIWLAPFGARTTLDLLRGLTVLSFPAAIAAGWALRDRPRWTAIAVAAAAVWAAACAFTAVPRSCHVQPIDVAEIQALRVDRCTFRWRKTAPAVKRMGIGLPPDSPSSDR
jgi:hypothetical protein